jgi:hypothetical protein
MQSVELLDFSNKKTFLFKVPKSFDLQNIKFSDFEQTKQIPLVGKTVQMTGLMELKRKD